MASPAIPADVLASWPDEALIAEIGLRTIIGDEGSPVEGLELSLLSLEGTVPAFAAAAEDLLARARVEGIPALGLAPALALLVEEALRRGL